MPALLLNYFGQGALILDDPAAIQNPFYLLAPEWGRVPLLVLATAAAIIASQAVISGAFSLTRAAIQMGYCPRLTILHTSERAIGQIYVPFINWMLLAAIVALVVGFRNSDNLAGRVRHRGDDGDADRLDPDLRRACGGCGTGRVWVAIAIATPLLLIDLTFLASNSLKIPDGGWFPLLIGGIVFTLLTTWKRGRSLLMHRLAEDAMPLDLFIQSIEASPPTRVPGHRGVPHVDAEPRAARAAAQPEAQQGAARARRVPDDRDRATSRTCPTRSACEIEPLGCNFYRMIADYGFKDDPGRAGAARGLRAHADSRST